MNRVRNRHGIVTHHEAIAIAAIAIYLGLVVLLSPLLLLLLPLLMVSWTLRASPVDLDDWQPTPLGIWTDAFRRSQVEPGEMREDEWSPFAWRVNEEGA